MNGNKATREIRDRLCKIENHIRRLDFLIRSNFYHVGAELEQLKDIDTKIKKLQCAEYTKSPTSKEPGWVYTTKKMPELDFCKLAAWITLEAYHRCYLSREIYLGFQDTVDELIKEKTND